MIGRVMKIADLVTNCSVGMGLTRMMGTNSNSDLEIFTFDGKRKLKSYVNLNTMISIKFEDKYIEVIYMSDDKAQSIMKINRNSMTRVYPYKVDGIEDTIEVPIDLETPLMDTDSTFMPHTIYKLEDSDMLEDLHVDEYYFKSHDMKFVYDGNRWLNINSRLHSKFGVI